MMLRKWWWLWWWMIPILVLGLLVILFFMRGRPARENLFDCGNSETYIQHLSNKKSDLFRKLANYIVNRDTVQSQTLIGKICTQIKAKKRVNEIDKSIENTVEPRR